MPHTFLNNQDGVLNTQVTVLYDHKKHPLYSKERADVMFERDYYIVVPVEPVLPVVEDELVLPVVLPVEVPSVLLVLLELVELVELPVDDVLFLVLAFEDPDPEVVPLVVVLCVVDVELPVPFVVVLDEDVLLEVLVVVPAVVLFVVASD